MYLNNFNILYDNQYGFRRNHSTSLAISISPAKTKTNLVSKPSQAKPSQAKLSGQDKLIFSIDITSLYTVIPNSEGLEALKHFFDQRTVKEPSSETLLRLAELVLTLNCFSFAGNYYKQINGVAMGTRMGPSYANLFVGYVEHQFFNQYKGPKPELYGRYIDDCISALFHPAEKNSIIL